MELKKQGREKNDSTEGSDGEGKGTKGDGGKGKGTKGDTGKDKKKKYYSYNVLIRAREALRKQREGATWMLLNEPCSRLFAMVHHYYINKWKRRRLKKMQK